MTLNAERRPGPVSAGLADFRSLYAVESRKSPGGRNRPMRTPGKLPHRVGHRARILPPDSQYQSSVSGMCTKASGETGCHRVKVLPANPHNESRGTTQGLKSRSVPRLLICYLSLTTSLMPLARM